MISLVQLKQALSPLESFGKDERTFILNGSRITVRPLLPWEEVHVQRVATTVLEANRDSEESDEDGSLTRAAALDYFDRFRIEVLAHAVVQIDGVDLRSVKVVATGEVLDSGVPVTIPKYQALRDMIREGWSRPALTIAFGEYGELVQKLQDEADNIARKSIEDLDVEAQRLEDRLKEVRLERGRRTIGDPTVFNHQVDTLLQADAELERQTNAARAEIQAARMEEDEQPVRRESQIPAASPPPGAPVLNPETDTRIPPQVLSNRGKVDPGKLDLNPSPRGAVNPNFRPNRGN